MGKYDDSFFSEIKSKLQKRGYVDAVKILKDKIERFIPTVISYIDFKNFFVNEVLPIPVFSKNAKHSKKQRIYGNFDEFNKKKEEWLEYAGKYIEEFLKKILC